MENLIEKILKGNNEAAASEIMTMTEDSLSRWVNLYEGVHGLDILKYLCDYFYESKNEVVIRPIRELCLIHLAYLDVEKDYFYKVIKYAAQCYPNKEIYKEVIAEYESTNINIAKGGSWVKQEVKETVIVDGLINYPSDYRVIIEKHSLTLQDFLLNDIEKLSSQIQVKAWEKIIKETRLTKREPLKLSYQNQEGEYVYYWKNEDTIIVISFSEKQPGRYVSKVIALFKYV